MLQSGSSIVRAGAAKSYEGSEPSLPVIARLLEIAKTDPDVNVRGAAWEALGHVSDEPEVRRAMLAVLQDPAASIAERGGAAVALAQQSDNQRVFDAIAALYDEPGGRARALKAMARSMDRRFAEYPARHLDDTDPEIRLQAIWGIGYLNLSSDAPRLKAFFDQEKYRTDALFAYALACPGETSPGRARSLLEKVGDAAGGFREGEEELVKIAIDQRLRLHGKNPFFFADDDEDAELEEPQLESASSSKIGRNDLCPCGSGKKYKKCCGAPDKVN